MNTTLSDRVSSIKPSPTLAVTARAAAMRAAGKDIVGLGAGEPDFDTPEPIKQAAIRAIQDGFTKYTAVDGTPGLKKAIVAKFKRENGLDYETRQVLVSCGGKQSFYNLAQALLNPGDEVIIPAPYWVSYPDMVLLASATPVIVDGPQSQQFKITPAQLEAAITEKTRLFVINSPSNPSGMAYREAELKALGAVLRRHPDIIIATDDMYEHILWREAGGFVNILNANPDLYERTMVLNGVSKAYSMTGWRIGYAAGPAWLIEAMTNIQSQSTSNPTSISQVAAEAALNGDQGFIGEMLKAFRERHDYVVGALNAIPDIECLATDGTFYVFPDARKVIARLPGIEDDLGLAEFLIEHGGVAVVPGSAFGAPGHIRLSIATSMANLEKAMTRIGTALA
ncbi:MAG: pyridoxal phosphate-dependent aminotransferase [Methylococcaceae bacterium]|nr:pyridoxal phosphate-dependent aminotransferase [Methylococcaceae bacterium]